MSRDPTCAERIEGQVQARLGSIAALNDLASVTDSTRVDEVLQDRRAREALAELSLDPDASPDQIAEAAERAGFPRWAKA
jgi:hypothetical protein